MSNTVDQVQEKNNKILLGIVNFIVKQGTENDITIINKALNVRRTALGLPDVESQKISNNIVYVDTSKTKKEFSSSSPMGRLNISVYQNSSVKEVIDNITSSLFPGYSEILNNGQSFADFIEDLDNQGLLSFNSSSQKYIEQQTMLDILNGSKKVVKNKISAGGLVYYNFSKNLLQAIKELKDCSGLGLKEAKDIIDSINGRYDETKISNILCSIINSYLHFSQTGTNFNCTMVAYNFFTFYGSQVISITKNNNVVNYSSNTVIGKTRRIDWGVLSVSNNNINDINKLCEYIRDTIRINFAKQVLYGLSYIIKVLKANVSITANYNNLSYHTLANFTFSTNSTTLISYC